MQTFQIDDQIFERYPDALIGLLVARGMDNRGQHADVEAFLREQESALPERFGESPVVEHPRIKPWREAYRSFGAKPKKYPSSVESLCRRALAGKPLPIINTLVDTYNAISLKHLLPAGGEDLAAVKGNARLTFAGGTEPAVRMLGEKDARAPYLGEVIYRDELGAICRRWNWKEADRTKLTEATQEAILVLEALPPASGEDLRAAMDELASRVQQFCGAEITANLLGRARKSAPLSTESTI